MRMYLLIATAVCVLFASNATATFDSPATSISKKMATSGWEEGLT